MRTDAEKQAFAMKCLEIEKAGGDVREYIAKNWPSYTPRATWYNLQREYLKRNTAQLTEGKPDPEREEVKEMNKMRAVAAELVNNYADNPDADVAKYLTECGYTNLPSALRNLRQWAKTNEPGWLPDLQKCSIRKKVEKKADPDAKKVKKQIVERLDNFTKKIQESEERTGKPSPTCCQPAPPSGVTVPDELPKESDVVEVVVPLDPLKELPIWAVKGTFGEFERASMMTDAPFMTYIWRDILTHEEKSISFDAKNWLRMCDEIKLALKQLGLN